MSIIKNSKTPVVYQNNSVNSSEEVPFYTNYLKPFTSTLYQYYTGNVDTSANLCKRGMVSVFSLFQLNNFTRSIFIDKSIKAIPKNIILFNNYNNIAFRFSDLIKKLKTLLDTDTFINIKALIFVGVISFFFSLLPIIKYLLIKNQVNSYLFGLFYKIELGSSFLIRNIFLQNSELKILINNLPLKSTRDKINKYADYFTIISVVLGLAILVRLKPEFSVLSLLIIIYSYYYFYRNDRDFFIPHITALLGTEENQLTFEADFLREENSKEDTKDLLKNKNLIKNYYRVILPTSRLVEEGPTVTLKISPLPDFNENFLILGYNFTESVIVLIYRLLKIIFCSVFNLPSERLLKVIEDTIPFYVTSKTMIKIYVINYVYCRTILTLVLENNLSPLLLIVAMEAARSFDCNDLLVKELTYLNFPLLPRYNLNIFLECILMLALIQYFKKCRERDKDENWEFLKSGGLDQILTIYIWWLLLDNKLGTIHKKGENLVNYLITKKEWIRVVINFLLDDLAWIFPLNYFNAPLNQIQSEKYWDSLVKVERVILDPIYFLNSLLSSTPKIFENHVENHSAYRWVSLFLIVFFKLTRIKQKNLERTIFNELCSFISLMSLSSSSK